MIVLNSVRRFSLAFCCRLNWFALSETEETKSTSIFSVVITFSSSEFTTNVLSYPFLSASFVTIVKFFFSGINCVSSFARRMILSGKPNLLAVISAIESLHLPSSNL